MRITGSPDTTIAPTAPVGPVLPRPAATRDTAGTAGATAPAPVTVAPLQSATLAPALAALRAMPDIDLERVAALRDAIARGEVPFDAKKLAGLIQRFHGRTA